MDSYVGFDSAWTDNPRAPGCICAVEVEAGRPVRFHPPEPVSFAGALAFIRRVQADGCTLVALDQPTLVPNATGMRPVERAAASLISWLGGGVQPANQGRTGMFCAASPVWGFLKSLDAKEDPPAARTATEGLHLMEVFPAIALASLDPDFFGRGGAPRYNPARAKTYRPADWGRVAAAAAREAERLGCGELAAWCRDIGRIPVPRKPDQDRLDAALCALVALRWRLRPAAESLLLGDLVHGYMVLPASPAVRERLLQAARKYAVPVDGALPG